MSANERSSAAGAGAPTGPILTASGATVRYPGSSSAALCNVSFTVQAGQSVALLGANGSGKSTLLKAIIGELALASGTLTVPRPVATVAQHEQLRRDVPISALELATMGAYHRTPLLRRVARADRELAAEALRRVGLQDAARKPVSELSGGQRQRVLLARALVHGGEVLALDEPLAAIDPGSAELIHAVLEQERAAGHTLLVATHDLAELHRWDRVLVLSGGCQLAYGPPSELDDGVLEQAYAAGGHGHGPCDHDPAVAP